MPLVPGSADLPPELQELLDESTEMIDANITLTQQRAIKKQSKNSLKLQRRPEHLQVNLFTIHHVQIKL